MRGVCGRYVCVRTCVCVCDCVRVCVCVCVPTCSEKMTKRLEQEKQKLVYTNSTLH